MRIRTTQYPLITLYLIFTGIVTGCGDHQHSDPAQIATPITLQPTSVPTGISTPAGGIVTIFPDSEIPAYPGGQAVQIEAAKNPATQILHFQTIDSASRVLGFYKEALPKNGWVLDKALDSQNIIFVKTITTGDQINIGIKEIDKNINEVEIRLFHPLNFSDIPLYKDAYDIQIDITITSDGNTRRTTIYKTSTDAGSIKDYYRQTLKEQGWRLVNSSQNDELDFIHLIHIGPTDNDIPQGIAAHVMSEPNTQGDTRVQLSVEGSASLIATPER